MEAIMARARNIKPAFFQNEDLAELKPIERLAFIAMWTVADYRGCIEYRAKRLKVQLLPYDNCDIDAIVTNLEQSRFITTYNVNEQNYIKILNFEKHQNPHPNERKAGSTIPDFDESNSNINKLQTIVTNHDKDGTSHADSLIPITDSLLPIDSKKQNTKGSRLSQDWIIPVEYIKFCQTERPELNVKSVADTFKDYWISKSGSTAVKTDWFATWRNWVRRQEARRIDKQASTLNAALSVFKPQYIAEQTAHIKLVGDNNADF
jgi:uncharacterized protein YlbG (UPF0298 family)